MLFTQEEKENKNLHIYSRKFAQAAFIRKSIAETTRQETGCDRW